MVRVEDDTDLVPIQDSPVLRERGLLEQNILGADGKPLKAGEWVRQRVIKNLGSTSTAKGDNEEKDVEILKGKGWLQSEPPGGGRNQVLRITAAGEKLLIDSVPGWERAQAEANRLIGDAGVAALRDIASRLGLGSVG